MVKFKLGRKARKNHMPHVSMEDITTEDFVLDSGNWYPLLLQSARMFPRVEYGIYDSVFLCGNLNGWVEFLADCANIPPPEKWHVNHIIKDTIDFERKISKDTTIVVSYTKPSSSYDGGYTVTIDKEGTVKFTIVFLDSWDEIHRLLSVMLYARESADIVRREHELSRVMEIYPKEKN